MTETTGAGAEGAGRWMAVAVSFGGTGMAVSGCSAFQIRNPASSRAVTPAAAPA